MTKRLLPKSKRICVKINNMGSQVFGSSLPIYHVVEYPKCGGTWLMRLLRTCHGQETVEGWELFFMGGKRFYKRHTLPLAPFRRPIVVVRDPRDVWVSFYFHTLHLHENQKVAKRIGFNDSVDESVKLYRFIELNLEHPREFEPGFSYEEFVRSWKTTAHCDPIWVKYEDMQEDTVAVLQNIASRFNWGLDDGTIRSAVEQNTFKRLAGRDKGVDDAKSHKRKGIVGDWRNHFTDEMLEYVREHQAYLFTELGYGE